MEGKARIFFLYNMYNSKVLETSLLALMRVDSSKNQQTNRYRMRHCNFVLYEERDR